MMLYVRFKREKDVLYIHVMHPGIRIDRRNPWSPCVWIGHRAFAFGVSDVNTDPWPVSFMTFGYDPGAWSFSFPWWERRMP
jgi:hypothetical protein